MPQHISFASALCLGLAPWPRAIFAAHPTWATLRQRASPLHGILSWRPTRQQSGALAMTTRGLSVALEHETSAWALARIVVSSDSCWSSPVDRPSSAPSSIRSRSTPCPSPSLRCSGRPSQNDSAAHPWCRNAAVVVSSAPHRGASMESVVCPSSSRVCAPRRAVQAGCPGLAARRRSSSSSPSLSCFPPLHRKRRGSKCPAT